MFKALFKRHTSGLMVSSTGAVFVPATQYRGYVKPAHWTYGHDNGNKHLVITISRKRTYVHRLVAETFLERIPGMDIIDHIDRDPTNNSVSNLRFTDTKGNMRNKESYEQARIKLGLPLTAEPKEVKQAYMRARYWKDPLKSRKKAVDRYWENPEKARECRRKNYAKAKELSLCA